MTAWERAQPPLERALEIVWTFAAANQTGQTGENLGKSLADAIHRAIIEHSNAELERRRAVEARMRQAHELLWAVVEAGAHHGLPTEVRERIEKALEGRDV